MPAGFRTEGPTTSSWRARTRSTSRASLAIPIIAPQAWANWSRAADQLDVPRASERDVQRTVAITAARAYLTIFAQKRQVDVNRQARDNSLAHMPLRRRPAAGRDRQPARLGARRPGAGVERGGAPDQLREPVPEPGGAGHPARGGRRRSTSEEIPDIPAAPTLDQALDEAPTRADVLLYRQQQKAADRSLNLSWTEYLPTHHPHRPAVLPEPRSLTTPRDRLAGAGAPHLVPLRRRSALRPHPPARGGSCRRRASSTRRCCARRTPTSAPRWTTWSARGPRWSVRRNGAQLANDAMRLADVAYRAGASTNLELIDAQRRGTGRGDAGQPRREQRAASDSRLPRRRRPLSCPAAAGSVQSLNRQDAVRNLCMAGRGPCREIMYPIC